VIKNIEPSLLRILKYLSAALFSNEANGNINVKGLLEVLHTPIFWGS
jgi:hypothetical protein